MKTMKKLVAALLVLAMALSLMGVAFAVESKYEPGTRVKFTGTCYGYEKPGASQSKVIVKKDSIATSVGSVIKKGKEWVLIEVDDVKGARLYFSAAYLKKYTGGKDDLIVFAAGGSGRSFADDTEGTVASKYKKVKATAKVNIREKASLEGKSLGVLYKGQTLKLAKDHMKKMDTRGVWFYHIQFKGKDRWISEKYTQLK